MSGGPLIRQWTEMRLLAGLNGATVQELANKLEVNAKTIRRDLETLQNAGFPLTSTVGDHGQKRWRIVSGNGPAQLAFNLDEALALYLGRRLLDPLAGTFLWQAAQQAFQKVRACLGPAAVACYRIPEPSAMKVSGP